MMKTRVVSKFLVLVGALSLTIMATACAPEDGAAQTPPSDEAPAQTADADATASSDSDTVESDDAAENLDTPGDEPGDEPGNGPRTQAVSCEWDVAGPTPSTVTAGGQTGELEEVLIGSWQHTYFDSGSGFEAVSNDIRYVFPSTSQMIYCQHVPGVTNQAENKSEFKLQGNDLVLPGGHPGFVATDWSDDVLMLHNNFDGSTYLLQRR